MLIWRWVVAVGRMLGAGTGVPAPSQPCADALGLEKGSVTRQPSHITPGSGVLPASPPSVELGTTWDTAAIAGHQGLGDILMERGENSQEHMAGMKDPQNPNIPINAGHTSEQRLQRWPVRCRLLRIDRCGAWPSRAAGGREASDPSFRWSRLYPQPSSSWDARQCPCLHWSVELGAVFGWK